MSSRLPLHVDRVTSAAWPTCLLASLFRLTVFVCHVFALTAVVPVQGEPTFPPEAGTLADPGDITATPAAEFPPAGDAAAASDMAKGLAASAAALPSNALKMVQCLQAGRVPEVRCSVTVAAAA